MNARIKVPGPARRTRQRGPGRPAGGSPDVRAALLEGARKLFLARGFASVSIRQVAAEAGTSTAMIHYHFGDKLGLYRAMLDEAVAPVAQALQRLGDPAREARVDVTDVMRLYAGMLAANPWVPALIVQEVLAEGGQFRTQFVEHFAGRLVPLVVRIITREQERGTIRSDVDPRLAALSAMSLTVFAFLARPVTSRVLGLDVGGDGLDTFIEHSRRVLLEGIAAPEVTS
ncbi:MAG TPA: TetR/AcrR family transcriptional regulator [Steroidobacteraceae bacterium]